MRIDSIQLKNYRCYTDQKVDFRPGFNVLVGVNGSGKTSLLKGLCEALNEIPRGFNLRSGHLLPLSDEADARLNIEISNGRYRFEPQYPIQICATANFDDGQGEWRIVRSDGHPVVDWQYPNGNHARAAWARSKVPHDNNALSNPFPLVAFYRATRHWTSADVSVIQAATERPRRDDGYSNWWNASLDSNVLQSWAIGKCLERYQKCSETNVAFDDVHDDELALVNQALATAIEGGKGLKYDMAQRSLIFEWHRTSGVELKPVPFENLSDGQRAVVGLVADIARRMCLLNPRMGSQVTDTPGVVLIDELDMHLHPRWQRILTSGLKHAFPAIQFIVASHSPQVLGELQPEEIILLRRDGIRHPQASYGLTSSQVLDEIMGGGSRSTDVNQLLSEVNEALTRGNLDLGRTKIEELEKLAAGVPELVGLRALLRRKEVLGR